VISTNPKPSATSVPADNETINQILRKVSIRLMPILILANIFSYMDRVNVGFAALTANRDLGLSPLNYAFGASLFFVSYFLFELPSNLVMQRVGARFWISRIMITWGLVSASMALVVGPYSFYAVRFLLGVAEAGFFPGVLLYITYWFPSEYRARYIGLFQLAIPMATVIGAPMSGMILSIDHFAGLKSWQLLYIIEAMPPIILGLVSWFYLTDRPAQAAWLEPQERKALQDRLDLESREKGYVSRFGRGFGLVADRRVLFYAALFFTTTSASSALSLWLPQIVKGFGLSNLATGFVSATPFVAGAIAMVTWGWVSDRLRERRWCSAIPSFLAALSLGACVFTDNSVTQMIFIIIAGIGIFGVKGPSLALMTEGLTGAVGAGGLALVSSIGNLSGFVAPYVIGWIKTETGNFSYGLLFLAFVAAIAGVLPLFHGRQEKPVRVIQPA
jgi:MFS transporter, ACS family, tartrate transporter